MKTDNPSLVCSRVTKRFGDVTALDEVSFEVAEGQYVCVIGPSGAGKTTLLRVIAGLERPDTGTIRIHGRNQTDVRVEDRDVAMVFQGYALFPHLNVYENIAVGMRVRREPKDQIAEKVRNAVELLGIEPLLERKPRQLSGGEQQRVALARALVRSPNLFLLDEPLANLDADTRLSMRNELKMLQEQVNRAFLHVTHDQFEAFAMADTILLLDGGELRDAGSPEAIYSRPLSMYSAQFIGWPKLNFVTVAIAFSSTTVEFRGAGFHLTLDINRQGASGLPALGNREIVLGIRPESFSFAGSQGLAGIGKGRIVNRERSGSVMVHSVEIGGSLYSVVDRGKRFFAVGGTVDVYVDPTEINYFDPATGGNLLVASRCDIQS